MTEAEVWKASIAQQPEWWNTDCWATPWHIVRGLESEFGAFDLDPCCQHMTAKAPRYFTPAEDGLQSEWFGRVFMNPPYSKPGPWLQKAIAEVKSGRADLVAALLPASTDTRWFHELVLGVAEVRFLQGRIRFLGWSEQPLMRPKWGSCVAIYKRTAVWAHPNFA